MRVKTENEIKCTKINILLFNEFSNLCLANALEPLRAANFYSNQTVYEWTFYTLDGEPALSSSGIKLVSSGIFSPLTPCDRLFIISSYGYKTLASPLTYKLLRQCKSRIKSIIGFDTGSWLLAHAGLLENKRATIHWDVLDTFAETFLNIDVIKKNYVIDDGIITCSGAMASFDLALHLIEEDCGSSLKFDVAGLFTHSSVLAITPQAVKSTNRRLTTQAVMLMQNNLETPISIKELCDQLGCNTKKLERAFKNTFDSTTGKIYRRMRLLLIRQLIENTDLPISEIAIRGGYENASSMTRAFVDEHGFTPSSLRKNPHEPIPEKI